MTYKDYCGTYRLTQHRNGTITVWHSTNGRTHRVGEYKTVQGAKIGLAKYCGGMPELVKEA